MGTEFSRASGTRFPMPLSYPPACARRSRSRMSRILLTTACLMALAACSGNGQSASPDAPPADAARPPVDGAPFQVEQVTSFNEPWAMTFLPDGRLLVTEKP